METIIEAIKGLYNGVAGYESEQESTDRYWKKITVTRAKRIVANGQQDLSEIAVKNVLIELYNGVVGYESEQGRIERYWNEQALTNAEAIIL